MRVSKLRVLADENIPGLESVLGGVASLHRCAGRQITAQRLADIDVLLVRSVTPVDRDSLEGTPVRFVGSCTTGIDHIDVAWLRGAGIEFAHAPGANARSVVEYVFSVLSWLALHRGLELGSSSVGIVGLGQVGGRLYRLLNAMGLRCLGYDPLVKSGGGINQVEDLDAILQCDIVSVHTPLTRQCRFPTWHLLGAGQLARLKPNAVLINSSRGSVVNNRALAVELERRPGLQVVLDVWENEPAIDVALLKRVALATPHIAGYSYDGKLAGVQAVVRRLFAHQGLVQSTVVGPDLTMAGDTAALPCSRSPQQYARHSRSWLEALCYQMLAVYDVFEDDQRMRRAIGTGSDTTQAFETLRRTYPVRRESSHFRDGEGRRILVDRLQQEGH